MQRFIASCLSDSSMHVTDKTQTIAPLQGINELKDDVIKNQSKDLQAPLFLSLLLHATLRLKLSVPLVSEMKILCLHFTALL